MTTSSSKPTVAEAITRWEGAATPPDVVRCGKYLPNGGTPVWDYSGTGAMAPSDDYVNDLLDSDDWETADLSADGRELVLFRHNGEPGGRHTVLEYRSFEWVDAAAVAGDLMTAYAGEGNPFWVGDLTGYSDWLESDCGLDEGSDAHNACMIAALDAVKARFERPAHLPAARDTRAAGFPRDRDAGRSSTPEHEGNHMPKTKHYAGWDIRLHESTADDLISAGGDWDETDIDASVGKFNEMLEATVRRAFPGAEITRHTGRTVVYQPDGQPDDDQAYEIQWISENIWGTFDWCVNAPTVK